MYQEKLNTPLLAACTVLSIFCHTFFILNLHLTKIEQQRKPQALFHNQSAKTLSQEAKEPKTAPYTKELQHVLNEMLSVSRQGKIIKKEKESQHVSQSIQNQSSISDFDREQFFASQQSPSSSSSSAESPFASLGEGHPNKNKPENGGELVKGDVLSSQLNEFDNTGKRLQLGLRSDSLPTKVKKPSLQAESNPKAKQTLQGPFILATPSQREQVSPEITYHKPSAQISHSFAESIEGKLPSIDELLYLPDIANEANNLEKTYGESLTSNDDFSVSLQHAYNAEGKVIFQVRLLPKGDINFKRISQNISFLVDRSSSIGEQKFQAFKKAIQDSLAQIHPEDKFNIVFFDNELSSLSDTFLSPSKENLAKAKNFITQQQKGGLFASTDLYQSLEQLIPHSTPKDQINLALLLTDGDTYLNLKGQRKTIYDWTQKNNRMVSLFTFATGKQNNLPLLELLSSLNKGKLIHVSEAQDFSKSMQNFLASKNKPIGKDIILTAIAKDKNLNIQLYPREDRLPDLYEGAAYTVYGEIDQKEDFVLFLQGKHYQNWLNIKQVIHFNEGLENTLEVSNNWAIQKARVYYERYLEKGVLADLRQANHLLNSLKTRSQQR